MKKINRNNKKKLEFNSSFLAGVVGFEPTQAVLETDVLPLTLYPYEIDIIYDNILKIRIQVENKNIYKKFVFWKDNKK